ncbi:unnamed protein product [Lota lota]
MLVHRPWTVTDKRNVSPCSMAETTVEEEEETDEAEEDDSAVAATMVTEIMVAMMGEQDQTSASAVARKDIGPEIAQKKRGPVVEAGAEMITPSRTDWVMEGCRMETPLM